ncbi:sulfurtransferase [Thiomonas delicata]|uniref:Putative sulfurtransferase n=1 Tax=Thiomonas delicata TaxID=364030 RepID=A0A238D2Q9_THIDL|nr:rhodanese-like domain-containing protein [Thiomonas delicata]SBP87578.1 putative sulfurtransferase [Thiomonas delicata]
MKFKYLMCATVLGLGFTTAQGAMAMGVPGPLVTPQWLKAHLADVVVLDIRDGDGLKSFDEKPVMTNNMVTKSGGHIAGALQVNFNNIREARTVDGIKLKAMMPTAEYFTRVMDGVGLNSGKPIIIVPTGATVFTMDYGARLYFQMRYFGVPHGQVAILNGGTNAWLNAGFPVSTKPAPISKGDWKAMDENKALLATTSEVKEGLRRGTEQYIDARPTAQFLGIAKKPIDKTAGHLPGAKSFPIDAIVKDDRGATMFMNAADYKQIFHVTNISDSAPTTTYCNTGHLASGAWFVVHEIMGNQDSRMYAGSMNEWTNLGNPTVGLPG